MATDRSREALFRTLAPGAAAAIIDEDRYDAAATALARLARSGRSRRWDPAALPLGDPGAPRLGLMPEAWFPEGRTASVAALPAAERARLGDEILRWLLSGILHGEQAALTICSQLCTRFAHPAARAFAAGQAEEEARHVEAFTRYIAARFGPPYPAGDAFGAFLGELVAAEGVTEKLVGICLLVEGFAMGAFANIHAHTRDPALKTLLQNVMRDEAVHHQFGLLWAEGESAALPPQARRTASRTALRGFRALYLNLVSIHQRRRIFAPFGLDWRRVRDEVRSARADRHAPPGLEASINPLAVLGRTLHRSGLLSPGDARALDLFVERADRAAPA